MTTKPTEQDAMAEIIHGVLMAAQEWGPKGRFFSVVSHAAAQNLIAAGFGDIAANKIEEQTNE